MKAVQNVYPDNRRIPRLSGVPPVQVSDVFALLMPLVATDSQNPLRVGNRRPPSPLFRRRNA
jgi:hypothetical protein